jgi:hypothetical protein
MSQGPVNTKCTASGVTTNKNTPNRNLNKAYDTKNADGLTPCEAIDKSQVCVKKGANDYNSKINQAKSAATSTLDLILNEFGKYPSGFDRTSMQEQDGPASTLKYSLTWFNRDDGQLFGITDGSRSISTAEKERMQKGAERFRAVKSSGRSFLLDSHKRILSEIQSFKSTNQYKDSPKRAQFDTQFANFEQAISEADAVLQGPELGGKALDPGSSCIETLNDEIQNLGTESAKDLFENVRAGVKQHGDMKKAVQDSEEQYAATRPGTLILDFSYDLQYKEQCILLSQIVPLAEYSYALDNTDLSKNGTTPDGEKEKTRRRLPYQASVGTKANAPLVVDGESFGFMNKLTQYPKMNKFYDIEPAQLSSLQPMIRLYKVTSADSNERDAYETEIAFDSYFNDTGYKNKDGDIVSLLKNKAKRGYGVGLKALNVTFDGQDMFAQKRCIKATLSIFAHDFDELLMERDFGNGTFRYIDLALKTGKAVKSDKIRKYKTGDDLNFRLKAVFGWQMPNGRGPASGLKRALKNTYVSVNLTPVTHNFDFDEFGRVTFNIEYLAYIEEFYSKPTMDIFTDSETFSNILRRKLAFESANRTISNSAEGCKEAEELRKEIKEIKAADQETIKLEKKAMHARLINQLFLGDYIHYLNLSREDLESVIKLGPYHDVTANGITKGDKELKKNLNNDLLEAFSSGIKEGTDDKNKRKEMAGALMVTGGDSVNIPFFYVGDLLNVIMGSMTDFLVDLKSKLVAAPAYQSVPISQEILQAETTALTKAAKEYEKFRLILGPLEIVNHADESVRYVNFADVPISVKYFSEWLTSKLLKKNQAVYPLTQFLKDLFNDLLRNFLNDDSCYPFSVKQKTRLFEGVVTSYPTGASQKGTPPVDEITQLLKGKFRNKYNRLNLLGKDARDINADDPKAILNLRGKSPYDRPNPGMASEMNYFIFYAGRTQPLNLMNGQKTEDEKRGIFHYMLGKEKGLLKTINLNKTDTPGLKEVRFEQEGYDGLHQLREVYDVEIDSYANMTTFPGNYIFVDPQGFAPTTAAASKTKFDLTDLGVGGYYMITKANHELGPGIANTKLNAVWVAAAMSAKDNAIIETARGSNEMKSAKCNTAQSAAGKLGTNAVAGYYEGSSGVTDLSRLDDNPESPREESAAAHTSVTGEQNVIGFGAGQKL